MRSRGSETIQVQRKYNHVTSSRQWRSCQQIPKRIWKGRLIPYILYLKKKFFFVLYLQSKEKFCKVLLRYNLYCTQFNPLRCSAQCVLVQQWHTTIAIATTDGWIPPKET